MELENNADFTIAQLSAALRRRRVTSVDLTEYCLDQIERLQPRLNAFISVTRTGAMQAARRADREIRRGDYRGPLHGVPMSLKDLFWTKGTATSAGSKILRRFVPKVNAAVVDRLLENGAVLLGKTNLHEFAFGATNMNPHYGPVRNPWDSARISGGSSGGSAAAVACGLGVYSLGTDTGGSIRIPAAACGCVGLKPTFGLVPLAGVVPLSRSLDHVGPICRSVEDAAIVLDYVAGEPRRTRYAASLSPRLQGLRIGIPKDYFFERLEPDVRAKVVEAALEMERAGARLKDVSIGGMKETADLAGTITVAEALAFHRRWLDRKPQLYGEDIRIRMQDARAMTALAYLTAVERCRAYAARMESVLQDADMLLAPSIPVGAPLIETTEIPWGRAREDIRLSLLRLTRPANLSGLPALTVPCGFTRSRLPVGLQLIGRRRHEHTILNAALAYELRTPWHEQFPQLPVHP